MSSRHRRTRRADSRGLAMTRPAAYRILTLLNAGSFVLSLVFLVLAAVGGDDVPAGMDGPHAELVGAAAIAVLAVVSCYALTRKRRGIAPADARWVAVVAAGLAAFILPALLAPALAPLIWWSLSALGACAGLITVQYRARGRSRRTRA